MGKSRFVPGGGHKSPEHGTEKEAMDWFLKEDKYLWLLFQFENP